MLRIKTPLTPEKIVMPGLDRLTTDIRKTPNESKPAKISATLTLVGTRSRQDGLDSISLRIEYLGRTELLGLLFDQGAVADEDDLRVCRIEIFLRGALNIRGR